MEEGETEQGLQLGHRPAAGGLAVDLHPSHSSPAHSFRLHERVWYGNTGIAA